MTPVPSSGPWLLGQIGLSRTYYEVTLFRQLDQWWHWLVLVLVCGVLLTAVTTLYFFDARQLARGRRCLLLLLRVLAFVGLLIFFLDLQKRTEQKIVKGSRFVFLVDTSQSMGIADGPPAEGDTPAVTRIEQVSAALGGSELLSELRQKHDVSLYRFDETNLPTEVAAFSQVEDSENRGLASGADVPSVARGLQEIRTIWRIAAVLLAVSLLAIVLHWILGNLVRTVEGESWALLASVLSLIVAVVLVGVSNLRHPSVGPRQAFGWATLDPDQTVDEAPLNEVAPADDDPLQQPMPQEVEWARLLEPAGASTRLGDAIAWVIQRERGLPLAGIGIITDGNGNRGIEPALVAQLASDALIPLYPIGIGSDQPPRNVRLVDLEAPARVYPGDEFKLTGYLQAYGMQGKRVAVQLHSRPENDEEAPEFLEEELDVELGFDGTVEPIPLQVTPNEVGKRVYWLRLADEDVDNDASDNQISAKVQVVERRTRVLLLAGGPTREYRFVRNLAYRDKDVSVDVLLQTATGGVSQESDDILFDLPRSASELYEYDCLVAFDPDWSKFDRGQLELIESWVAEKAGGMICIAGPVHTATWAENRRAPAQVAIVRQLYPVTFYALNASRIQLGRFGATTAWPITLTNDGRSAPFLSLADEDEEGINPWEQFAGVYGYYPVRGVKPAAAVYGHYSDPQAAIDGQPPLIVGHFYGAGRVVFLGTGEFWRLRAINNAYFERFYTKLIRFVSEGRLQRDSNRGLLLTDKDRALRGDAIAIRASVVDEQFQLLRDPAITVMLRAPDKSAQTIELRRADNEREGMYAGRFIATQAGDYRLELTLPGEGERVVLDREVRVRLPNLEIERPQRNDGLLRQLAEQTNGDYFTGIAAALGEEGGASLVSRVTSMRRETFLPGTPDRDFQRLLMTWLLVLICGTLFLEWLIRRLSKLA